MSLPWTSGSGLHTHFVTRLCLRLALSHTLTQHSTSTLLPEPERHGVTPQKVVTMVPFESWSDPPFASWGRPEFEPRFLPVWWMGLLGCFLRLSRFLFATRTHLLSLPGERLPLLDQQGPVAPGRGSPPGRPGMLSQWQGLKAPPSKSQVGHQKCCRRAWTETERAPKLLGSKFIKQASSDSVDSCPKAEPWEQRGHSLYTIYSRLQKWGYSLSNTLPYFIGCFNLCGEMTLLWSPGNIPRLRFSFVHCSTH
jgi:hypothetical protein